MGFNSGVQWDTGPWSRYWEGRGSGGFANAIYIPGRLTRELGVVPSDEVHFSRDQSVFAAGDVAIGVIGQEVIGCEMVLLVF
jgi:hypothetical protein